MARQSIMGIQLGALPTDYIFFQRRAGAVNERVLPVMGIVDGYVPIDRVTIAAGLPRKSAEVGQNEIGNTQIRLIDLKLSNSVDAHAKIRQLDIDSRRRVSRHKIVVRLRHAAHTSVRLVTIFQKAV